MSFNLLDHSVYLSEPQRATRSAWTQHVPFAMLLVDLARPRLLVELGTHTGMSYCAFCQAVAELRLDTRCFAVDTWEGDDQAGLYGPEILADLREHHDARYTSFSTLLQLRFDEANDTFVDGSIDLLHIDGFHTYEAVKHDVETWLPKMSERGVIVLHDVAEHGETFGVWKLWEELKQAHPHHLEFHHGHGLGVVAIGEVVPDGLLALMQLPTDQWLTMRDLFCAVGAHIEERIELGHAEQRIVDLEAEAERDLDERQAVIARLNQDIESERKAYLEAARRLDETQRSLDTANWQLSWLDQSRGVRMVKLARASRTLLRQRGAFWLAKRMALWTLGRRGYYRLDSAAALPVPKQPRPVAREYKQVMFLSGCPGGAMRYRCDHQAEQLNLLGCSAESAAISTVNLMDLLDRFQCFVLHRVPYNSDVQVFMAEARKRGKPLFFDTDDLVFVPDNAKHHAELERFSPQDRTLYIEEMGRIRQALHVCDAATVSTATLRDWVEPLCARVTVTPNAVSQEMVALSAAALANRAARPAGAEATEEVVIAYMSGSPSHDRDFLEAQDAVLWALETYPQVSLLLAGPLQLSDDFARFGARVRQEPFRPWQELPGVYARATINLAPLERDNPFTEAKSCIKYLEAGLLKVPTIASPRPDFTRVMRDGENGLLADTPDAWREALRRLIESPDERRQMGERAFDEITRLHTTPVQAPAVFDTLRMRYRAAASVSGPRRLRINWVVDAPDAEQPQPARLWPTLALAAALAERGHTVRLCVEQPAKAAKGASVAALQRQLSGAPVELVLGYESLPAADASVATSAATASAVAQSHESLFRFILAHDDCPSAADEAPSGGLSLRRICLEPTTGPEDAETNQLERTLLEYCW